VGRLLNVFRLSNVADPPKTNSGRASNTNSIEPKSPNIATEIEGVDSSDDEEKIF